MDTRRHSRGWDWRRSVVSWLLTSEVDVFPVRVLLLTAYNFLVDNFLSNFPRR